METHSLISEEQLLHMRQAVLDSFSSGSLILQNLKWRWGSGGGVLSLLPQIPKRQENK